jgi:hypothetical protein
MASIGSRDRKPPRPLAIEQFILKASKRNLTVFRRTGVGNTHELLLRLRREYVLMPPPAIVVDISDEPTPMAKRGFAPGIPVNIPSLPCTPPDIIRASTKAPCATHHAKILLYRRKCRRHLLCRLRSLRHSLPSQSGQPKCCKALALQVQSSRINETRKLFLVNNGIFPFLMPWNVIGGSQKWASNVSDTSRSVTRHS